MDRIDGIYRGGSLVLATSAALLIFAGAARGDLVQPDDLLFAVESAALTAEAGAPTGDWPCLYPPGNSLTAMTNPDGPTVEVIGGQKWAKLDAREGLATDGWWGSGFRFVGGVTEPIPINGATIVAVIRPKRSPPGTANNWDSVVDVFYEELVLSCNNGDGRLQVFRAPWRSGGWLLNGPDTAIIPDGMKAVVSLVVQPTGEFKVYVNGVEVWADNGIADMTQLVPAAKPDGPSEYARAINVGRNDPDGWCAFNGDIGNVYLYKVALEDGSREQLENELIDLFEIYEPSLSVSTTSMAFGKMKPGDSTEPQTITLKNVGKGNLTFASIVKGGPDAGDFVMDPDPASLAALGADESRTFTVAFAPQVASGTGPKSATITIDSASGPATIDLTGTAIYGEFQMLRPIGTVLELGDPAVGETGPWSDVRFRNVGFVDVTIESIEVTGDFIAEPASPTFPALIPNSIAGFKIAAKPMAAGMRTGKLTITYNNSDGGPDRTAEVDLVSSTTNRFSVAAGGDLQAAFESARATPGAVIEVAAGTYGAKLYWELEMVGNVDGVRFVAIGGTAVLPEPPAIHVVGGAGEKQTVAFENFDFTQEAPWEWLGQVWIDGKSTKNLAFRNCSFTQTNVGRAGDDGQPWVSLNVQDASQTVDLVVESCSYSGPGENTRDKVGIAVYNTDGYAAIRDCDFTNGRWQIRFADHTGEKKGVLEVKNCSFTTPFVDAVLGYNNKGSEIGIAGCAFSGSGERGIHILAGDTTVKVSGCSLNDFTVYEPISLGGDRAAITLEDTEVTQAVPLTGLNADTIIALYGGFGSRFDVARVNVFGPGPSNMHGLNGPTDGSVINLTDVTVTDCFKGFNFWSCRDSTVTVTRCTAMGSVENGFVFCPFGSATVQASQCTAIGNALPGFYVLCWDGTIGGTVDVDRSWFGAPVGGGGFRSEGVAGFVLRNSVIEGGAFGIQFDDFASTKVVGNCTVLGTTECSPGSIAIANFNGTAPATVINSIVLGYDALDNGVAWEAAGSNNIAFVEGAPDLVDPRLAYQGGALFFRPDAMSPVDDRLDCRPTAGSPAIDAGTADGAPDHDYAGNPRPQGSAYDIGAFEGAGGTVTARFRRGDADGSGKLDLTDAIATLQFLFMGGAAPPCKDAADTDDSGKLDLTDAIASLQFQFMGGPPPASPGPTNCGPDPTPSDEYKDCTYTNC